MKYTSLLCLASLASAFPALLSRDSCDIGFVFARGSMEPSPMGMLIGPQLESDLKKAFPKTLTTYPVLYSASLLTNLSPARTDQASIDKGLEAFRKAASCRIIIAAGYSQGAAVMHNVVSWKGLDSALKNKIAGVALFGDTRNQQDKGHILNFPAERSKVWCTPSDGVCGGQLNVNAAHLSYSNGIIKEAADWLKASVANMKGGEAPAAAPAESPTEAPTEAPAPGKAAAKGAPRAAKGSAAKGGASSASSTSKGGMAGMSGMSGHGH